MRSPYVRFSLSRASVLTVAMAVSTLLCFRLQPPSQLTLQVSNVVSHGPNEEKHTCFAGQTKSDSQELFVLDKVQDGHVGRKPSCDHRFAKRDEGQKISSEPSQSLIQQKARSYCQNFSAARTQQNPSKPGLTQHPKLKAKIVVTGSTRSTVSIGRTKLTLNRRR